MGINVQRHDSRLWRIKATYYSPQLRDAVRHVPGMRWDVAGGYGVGYVDALDTVVRRLAAKNINVNRGDLPTEPTTEHRLLVSYADLRDYQKTGVDFLLANAGSGALLADDMGLGKSLQALRAARAFKTKTVIACLHYVKSTWERELDKWWPKIGRLTLEGVKVAALPEDPKEAEAKIQATIEPWRDVEVIIINYDILHAWAPFLIAWGVRGLIIDEGHVCSNEKSRRTKAVRTVREVCAWCVGLTGTPMTNRPKDLWAVLNTISPGRMGDNFFLYGLTYCAGHKEEIDVRGD